MTFKKQFPSLEGKRYDALSTHSNKQPKFINGFDIEDIQKHCLDKKIVKEILDKQWGENSIDGNYKDLIRKLEL